MQDDALFAPYAPASNVLKVITRFRERGLPDRLTLVELQRVGVPEGNASRTLQALRFLGLVDEEFCRTDQFDMLGKAGTNEYPDVLSQLIRSAYQAVFAIVDPAQDDDIKINDAFRTFKPHAQRDKMVALFRGLCIEANILPRVRSERHSLKPASGLQNPSKAIKRQPVQSRQEIEASTTSTVHRAPVTEVGLEDDHYQVLLGIMKQLPKDSKWEKERREKWLQAFTASLDLLIEIE